MADEMTSGAENTTNEQGNNTPDYAVLQTELEKMKAENEKLKNAQSNASGEASKYKKMLNERMTEQEKAAAETKEYIESLKAENETLKRAQALAENKANLVGVGFDHDLAEKAATAFLDNDFAAFAGHLKDFVTAHDKAIVAEGIRNTPRPGVGSTGTSPITKEQFEKMGYADRVKIFNEQPDLYKSLTT